MLSPRDDDDDDTHLCIKCNATIVGLDEYVKHRKQRCGKMSKNETSKTDIPIDSLEPSSDVFFQSLELQSSAKKTSSARFTPPIPISKAVIDTKTTLAEASTSRGLPRMSPLDHNLRGGDWIGGHSLKIGINEDNQTKLINAVASISGTAKKEIPTSSYNIASYNDYKGDDDFDDSEVSEDEDEEENNVGGEKWKPPINYTGGKWRPASPENEEWDIRDEQEISGGKWKSFIANDREEDYDAPPPGHTKGKWVPGQDKTQIMQTTIQTKGSVQYWCGPCNRRLGSRAIYEKHLMSSLHMRKVLPEHELEFSGHLQPMRATDKRSTRPSRFLNDKVYSQLQKKKKRASNTKLTVKIEKKKRKRKPFFVQCYGCKTRVRQHLMGKHLISHYHFRKATDTKSTEYQQSILDNMTAIVHQTPFQCSPCKFYTNWLSSFMQHWFSKEHDEKMANTDGRFWCSFCKFECDDSGGMLQHMSGSEHSEVVAVINRSMPIIIRKKTILKCETCCLEFRYNMEMKQHCRSTGHVPAFTATDEYQEIHVCRFCKAKFKTSLTLAAHLKSKHQQKAWFCLVCEKTFSSSEESTRHRQTSEHRIRSKEKLKEKGVPLDLSKKCPYCPDEMILENVIQLKEHIRSIHPNIKKKCPKCGMAFVLSQEVTRHVRSNACQFRRDTPSSSSSQLWSCSQCLFTTDSQAECCFHEVLHSKPITEIRKLGDKEKVIHKYECPVCPKVFRKASLRHHLRQHTSERPYSCGTCNANFTRQSSLANHCKTEHGAAKKIDEKVKPTNEWKCDKCSERFTNRTALNRHSCSDADRRCPHDQCEYVAASPAQLARHRQAHGDIGKRHDCPYCDFKTNQSSHLKRHLTCHEGIKPYACPHCDFTCRCQENLKKHCRRRHPDLCLYKCDSCSFGTNLAKELRSHLTGSHSNTYSDNRKAIQAVKMQLLSNEGKRLEIETGDDE
ncbi:zinc finger protein Xfin [Amyelois transitella]|uniref:zinc finger protein Xfin n=1 Tax=Amyelois transitella TaxID=680683 RepID=UPI00067AFDB1|nr:zinc finger protein Xfin [Amyelois transitella]XP_060800484.1 zinc finger protein Xfin [Amyelois transitella]XP_060800485.1 zinc finger protein Xfin [Amyelois transitella]